MESRPSQFLFVSFALLFVSSALGQQRSGIPAIDTLPLNDWHVETPELSYRKALLYSLLPGGGQIYGRRYVRAGFLIGLEGILFGDGIFGKAQLLENRRREFEAEIESAWEALDPDSSDVDFQLFQSRIEAARATSDQIVTQKDLRTSEIAWGIGLHFYGVMDAMELVYRSRNKQLEERSILTAMYRGMLFPGLGQIYNRRYGKFGMLWMAIGASAVSAYSRQQVVNYYQERLESFQREEQAGVSHSLFTESELLTDLTLYRKRRNQYFWGITVLYIYSVMDAMVDAALSDFDAPERFALLPGAKPLSFELAWRF